jgi:probable rRNA maturation factor
MAEINLISSDKRFSHLRKPLEQTAAGVFKFLKMSVASVDINLIGAAAMRKINRTYRGKDEVTDVIAIEKPSGFPTTSEGFLGEIYLNPPCARSRGHALEYLLVHGILHLRGFNHLHKNDKIEMEKLEKKILAWLANTY